MSRIEWNGNIYDPDLVYSGSGFFLKLGPMRRILSLLLLTATTLTTAQEMKDNLFPTLNSSSLHLFYQSGKKTMIVASHRHSQKHGMVLETTSTYRKGKINPQRINFSVKYTEYHILSDNKRSLGKYEFGEDNKIIHYERSDFNNRNIRKWAYRHDYEYKHDILSKEKMITVEYLNEASVEADTAEYWETFNFDVEEQDGLYNQHPHEDQSVYTKFEMKSDRLHAKTNHFEGFDERDEFFYDDEGRLVKITNTLNGQDGNSIQTTTEISYNGDGLMAEVRFYDEAGTLLEKKVFSYK